MFALVELNEHLIEASLIRGFLCPIT